MKYREFEKVMSSARMGRYLAACRGDTRKAMTLYRYNLRLSQELFTVVSCLEIALRNAINEHYLPLQGAEWLRIATRQGGIFDNPGCRETKKAINEGRRNLGNRYTHAKLVATLGFGFWRFMFARQQYRVAGQTLMRIFPNKPTSTPQQQYNNHYVFAQLKQINDLRNRFAHHEPVCFQIGQPVINTVLANDHYKMILEMFNWLDIDEREMLYGLDHVDNIIDRINNLL